MEIPPKSDFSIDNIPFGVCSFPNARESRPSWLLSALAPSAPRCCTAIGGYAVDLHLLAEAGLLDDLTAVAVEGEGGSRKRRQVALENFHPRVVFSEPALNAFMECERRVWAAVRDRLISLFMTSDEGCDGDADGSSGGGHLPQPDTRLRDSASLRKQVFHPLVEATFHLPAAIGDYTDFYSSREHATNVGIMFRGKDNALQPNWLHMPIGYHGRSSSVYPSKGGGDGMSTVRRPCGQLQIDPLDPKKGSMYGPCKLMDFELEVAFFVGGAANSDGDGGDGGGGGRPLTFDEARDRIFGYVLMNDWSARDVQKWEYVPLGPFTSKNFATTISTWVVTTMALEPFRCETSAVAQGGGAGQRGGTELSEGIDVGGGGIESDPVPLEYLRDPDYGE